MRLKIHSPAHVLKGPRLEVAASVSALQLWRRPGSQFANLPTQKYGQNPLPIRGPVTRGTGKRILAAILVSTKDVPPQGAVELCGWLHWLGPLTVLSLSRAGPTYCHPSLRIAVANFYIRRHYSMAQGVLDQQLADKASSTSTTTKYVYFFGGGSADGNEMCIRDR